MASRWIETGVEGIVYSISTPFNKKGVSPNELTP